MAAASRHLRVFLSSTFRDMHAERDYLARHVFPRLRKLCEARGATLTDVDLRWGIPGGEAAEGGVLRICLDEIERCRPHFVGLLGDRYGSRPDGIPRDLAESEPWLAGAADRSITELEILHGVVRRPPGEVRASFYFRRPAAQPQDAGDASRLAALKDLVRAASRAGRVQLREDYGSVEELGAWLFEDFVRLIDELFPDAPPASPLEKSHQDHDAFARSRFDVYLRRASLHDRLTAWADGGGTAVIVTGGAGAGKSALLANWSREYAAARPGTLVFTHFIGATPQSADWTMVARRIVAAVRSRFGFQEDVPATPEALRAALSECLTKAAAHGPVLLVLDGLNQLEERDGAQDLVWLPDDLPAGVMLALSALPSPALEAARKRGWPSLQVDPFDKAERLSLIREYLAKYAKRLAGAPSERIAERPQAGNPRFLRALLEELRLFGVFEELDTRIAWYLKAESPRELYDRILARYEADYDAGRAVVRNAFSLLWASHRGLHEREILELLGTKDDPLPHLLWSPLLIAAEHSLIDRSGLLAFANDDFRQAVEARYLADGDAQTAVRRRLIEYFYEPGALGPRHREELLWQLYAGADWRGLEILLSDPEFFLAFFLDDEFAARMYWAELERRGVSLESAFGRVVEHPSEADPEFAFALSQLLTTRGYRTAAARLLDSLADRYRANGDSRALAACLLNLSVLARDAGERDRAAALLEEHRRLATASGDEAQIARALINEARMSASRGDRPAAMTLLDEAAAIAARIGRDDILGPCLGSRAVLLYEAGRLHEALELQKQVETLARRTANREELGASLGNQAFIHRELGEFEAALAKFDEALGIFHAIGKRIDIDRTLFNRAKLLEEMRG